MCIIIDTNTLSNVFKINDLKNDEFKPVLAWIISGKGKIVYGGTKYLNEIKKDYIALFSQLRKANKAIFIPNDIVDAEEINVDKILKHNDFDDQHLVALLLISKCKLICSLDKRAYPFFTSALFFNPSKNKPKIYSSIKNKNLLKDKNIAEICKPCFPTTNDQKTILGQLL